jgi:hypothetical protein
MANPASVQASLEEMRRIEEGNIRRYSTSIQAAVRRLLAEDACRDEQVRILSSVAPNSSVFHGLVRCIAAYSEREVKDMRQMRLRDDKTLSGRLWEVACRDWLLALTRKVRGEDVRVYANVWLLSEVPREVLQECNLMRLDAGIDLVAELVGTEVASMYDATKPHTRDAEGRVTSRYVAVQCKFRKPNVKGIGAALTWNLLSTFTGLCSMTGPWVRGLVMTNARGLGSRVPRKAGEEKARPTSSTDPTPTNATTSSTSRQNRKDVLDTRFATLAFRSMDRTCNDHWRRMAGTESGQRLGSAVVEEISASGSKDEVHGRDEEVHGRDEEEKSAEEDLPLRPPTSTLPRANGPPVTQARPPQVATSNVPVPDGLTGMSRGVISPGIVAKGSPWEYKKGEHGKKPRKRPPVIKGGRGKLLGGSTAQTPAEMRAARLARFATTPSNTSTPIPAPTPIPVPTPTTAEDE